MKTTLLFSLILAHFQLCGCKSKQREPGVICKSDPMSSHEIPANDSLDSEAVFSPLSDLSFEDRKYLDINPGFDLKLVPRWEGVISEIQKISDLKVRHGFYRRDASYNQFILDVSFNGGFRLIVFEKTRHAVESVAPEKIAKEGSNWMLFDNRNTH